MKLLAILIGLLSFTVSNIYNESYLYRNINIESSSSSIKKEFLITDEGVGIFKIGRPIPFPNVSSDYKIKKENHCRITDDGPIEEVVYAVYSNGVEMLNISLDYDYKQRIYTDKIGEILIISPRYKTKEGIGVNSTISEFMSVYRKHKLWYTYISGMYVIENYYMKAQFIIDEKDVIGKFKITSEFTELKKTDFLNGARIKKIRIF